ncbi:MAG: hypothetical protein D6701_03705 [Gemmatimonadetes bacterium]|nr:MAG: hypothetical protein D6701_03705 [Gemmatimonadota bacterium]
MDVEAAAPVAAGAASPDSGAGTAAGALNSTSAGSQMRCRDVGRVLRMGRSAGMAVVGMRAGRLLGDGTKRQPDSDALWREAAGAADGADTRDGAAPHATPIVLPDMRRQHTLGDVASPIRSMASSEQPGKRRSPSHERMVISIAVRRAPLRS